MLLLSNWCPFSPLGRRTCPYPRRWECPAHCGSEARNVLRPWHSVSLNFDALGLAADWPKHIAVAMVSAKCCLSYGECAKMCFRGVLKPQNVLKYAGGHFVFIKYGENAHWSHRSAALYVSQRDRLSSPGLKRLRHLVQPSNNFSISPTYGGREMHSVFALSDFRKRIPKIDSLSKRIPKMDWWPRDAFRIRIIRFSKTDSLSKRILKMDSLWIGFTKWIRHQNGWLNPRP